LIEWKVERFKEEIAPSVTPLLTPGGAEKVKGDRSAYIACLDRHWKSQGWEMGRGL
jgi:hypothetical protein